MALPSNDYFRVTAGYTGAAVPLGAANVFTVVSDPGTDLDDLAADFVVAITPLVQLMTTQIALTNVLVKQGPDETGPSAEFSVNIPGTSAANAVPSNTAVLIRKNTTHGGRTGRGRFYLPGLREDVVDSGGAIAGATVTSLQTAANSFYNGMVTAGAPLVLEHGPGLPSIIVDFLTSLTVSSKVATQRRRLRR